MAQQRPPPSGHLGVFDDPDTNLTTPGPLSHQGSTIAAPATLNIPVIVTGVFVPLILIVAIVVTIYVWYRRKYPVRMVLGRDFSRFSNPAYNKRASTLTLVRNDATVDVEPQGQVNRALTLVKEDDVDGGWDEAEVNEYQPVDIKVVNTNADASVEDKRSDGPGGESATTIVRERPKRALLIKENFEEFDKDFDLVTESDLSQRTESEVSSGNDSTETHTISLNFAETFDNRQAMSKSFADLSIHHVTKPSKSKSFGDGTTHVDIEKLTQDLPLQNKGISDQILPERGMSPDIDFKSDSQSTIITETENRCIDVKLQSINGSLSALDEQLALGDNSALSTDMQIGRTVRTERTLSMDNPNTNDNEFKIDPGLRNKKRFSLTVSTERILLENDPATPTVILQDSIIYESDSDSPVYLDTPSSPREKRSLTLGDINSSSPDTLELRRENMREWHSVPGFGSEMTPPFIEAPRLDTLKQFAGRQESKESLIGDTIVKPSEPEQATDKMFITNDAQSFPDENLVDVSENVIDVEKDNEESSSDPSEHITSHEHVQEAIADQISSISLVQTETQFQIKDSLDSNDLQESSIQPDSELKNMALLDSLTDLGSGREVLQTDSQNGASKAKDTHAAKSDENYESFSTNGAGNSSSTGFENESRPADMAEVMTVDAFSDVLLLQDGVNSGQLEVETNGKEQVVDPGKLTTNASSTSLMDEFADNKLNIQNVTEVDAGNIDQGNTELTVSGVADYDETLEQTHSVAHELVTGGYSSGGIDADDDSIASENKSQDLGSFSGTILNDSNSQEDEVDV